MTGRTVTILGINGHLAHLAAKAFVGAGWRVIGFGRSNKYPVAGVEFVQGDANSVSDMANATAPADCVFNGLNLPYDKWGNGAAEALMARVIAACGSTGKTLLFPGNIYNYSATDRVITPDLAQNPQTERGAIRKRMEDHIRQATDRGDIRTIIVRAGNFYGTRLGGDFFDALILREAAKRKVALNPARTVKNAWAYLPDLAQVFVILAGQRDQFTQFENFHFAGHLENADATFAAIQKAVPGRLERVDYPWTMLKLMGIFMPVIRGLVEMRYIWEFEMGLEDARLDAILGSDFGTPFETAVARTIVPFFEKEDAIAA